LRLFDVKTGKDLWKKTFAANTRILQSEEPYLTGALDRDGHVQVFDLRTHKTVLDTHLPNSISMDKASSVHLLADGQYFYLVCNEPADPVGVGFAAVQPIFLAGTGMRGLNVNGPVCCFKADGKLNWFSVVRHQMLILERFADLPVVLFGSRYQRFGAIPARPGNNMNQVSMVSALEKQTGKLKYSNENVQSNVTFHALNVDPRAGRVDFIGSQMKISFILESDDGSAAKAKLDPAGGGASAAPPVGASARPHLPVDKATLVK
jgi:hypothetical protein